MAENFERHKNFIRVSTLLALTLFSVAGAGRLSAQTVDSGYVFAGATFVNRLDGGGHFGAGLDFSLAPHLDLGGELGTIIKNDVGILASGDLTYHFNRPRRREAWDPFLLVGVSGARISGTGGFYLNLGGGMNYWVGPRWALRGEFKAYPRTWADSPSYASASHSGREWKTGVRAIGRGYGGFRDCVGPPRRAHAADPS